MSPGGHIISRGTSFLDTLPPFSNLIYTKSKKKAPPSHPVLRVRGESPSLSGPQTCCLMRLQFSTRGAPSLGAIGRRGQLTWSSGQKSFIYFPLPWVSVLWDGQKDGGTRQRGRMLTAVGFVWHTASSKVYILKFVCLTA